MIAAPYPGAILAARLVWVREHWWENPLMIFQVDATAWVPEEIRYSAQLWAVYVQDVAANNALTIYDEHGQPRLSGVTEYLAGQFLSDDWLAQG